VHRNIFWKEIIAYFSSYDTNRIEINAFNKSFSVGRVSISSEPLHSNNKGIHINTQRLMGETFIKIGSGFSEVDGQEIHRYSGCMVIA
jgi:hypothetical protein